MDLLQNAASVYNEMLDIEYLFIGGKSGILHSHILNFTPDEFKHIIGLHKLTDIPLICRSSSNNLLFAIKRNQLTLDDISTSVFYPKIKERIQNLINLPDYLNTASLFYSWDKKRSPYSNIDADIMIPVQSPIDKSSIYIFFKNGNNEKFKLSECIVETAESQKLVSLISEKRDYTKGQVRPPILLYKEKREISTGIKTVLIDKLILQNNQKQINTSISNTKKITEITLESRIADKVTTISTNAVCNNPRDLIELYELTKQGSVYNTSIEHICIENGHAIQTFDAYLHKTAEIEYAYNKFETAEEKPNFKELHERLDKFLVPFIHKECETLTWSPTAAIWERQMQSNRAISEKQSESNTENNTESKIKSDKSDASETTTANTGGEIQSKNTNEYNFDTKYASKLARLNATIANSSFAPPSTPTDDFTDYFTQ